MKLRLSGMTLGGKLSLGYLLVATFLFIFGGRDSELFLEIFGFPLMYIPWAYVRVFGETCRLPSAVAVPLLVLLWVSNAYLWGHAIAAVVRVLDRRFSRPADLGQQDSSAQPPQQAPPGSG